MGINLKLFETKYYYVEIGGIVHESFMYGARLIIFKV